MATQMPSNTQAKTCPECRLVNPPEAERCDCGWDFVAGRQERSYLAAQPKPVRVGLALILIYVAVRIVIAVVGYWSNDR